MISRSLSDAEAGKKRIFFVPIYVVDVEVSCNYYVVFVEAVF